MRITLNLLPPKNKAALRSGFIFAYAQSMLLIVFFLTAIASSTLLGVRLLLKGQYEDLAQRSTSTSDEYQSMTGEIKTINDYLKRMDAVGNRFVPWSPVLATITQLVPPGIQIDVLKLSKGGKIQMTGLASDRANVLLLRERLTEAGLFKDISSPLSNILQQKNVRFDFEMTYAPLAVPAAPPAK
jgi:Tfp pilus assembly protein PilN